MNLMAKFGCNVSFGSLNEIMLNNKNNKNNKNNQMMNQNDANNSKQQQQQQQNEKKTLKKPKQNIANVNDLVETCLHKTQKITVSKAFVKSNNKVSSITQSDNSNLTDNASIKDLSKLKSGDTLQICFLSNGLHVGVKLSNIYYIENSPSIYIFKGISQLNNKNYLINGNIDDKGDGEAELTEYIESESEDYQNPKPTTSSSSLSSFSCSTQIDNATNTFQVNCSIKTEPYISDEIKAPFLSSHSSQESLAEDPELNPSTSKATSTTPNDTSNKCFNKKKYLLEKYNQNNNDNSMT